MPELPELDRLKQDLKDWEVRNDALRKDNQRLRGDLLKLRANMASGRGLGAGWIVYSPNPTYNGMSCGIRIKNGVGFIQRDPEGKAARTIMELINEFKFRCEEVADFQEVPGEAQEQVSSNLAEVLTPPVVFPDGS